MPSKKVYSCSRPNQVSCLAYFSATSRQAARVLVGCGSPSDEEHFAHDQLVVAAADRVVADEDGLQHAVRAVARGLVGARAVEAPDRQAVRRASTILVFERSFAVGLVPSIQMYSAL